MSWGRIKLGFGKIDMNKLKISINTQLINASRRGDLPEVCKLVEAGADIHAFKDTSVHEAAYYGHLDVVKYLVSKGADVHADDDFALICAIENKHTHVVNYIKLISNPKTKKLAELLYE